MTPTGRWWRPAASTKRASLTKLVFASLIALALGACAQFAPTSTPPRPVPVDPVARFNPVLLTALPGWGDGRETLALRSFLRSCTRINKLPPNREMLYGNAATGRAHHWQQVCRLAARVGKNAAPAVAQRFFEDWFAAYRVSDNGNPDGLFTGYFEPLLNGSLRPSARYSVPLYKRPGDLISVNLGDFSQDLKGKQITGRLRGNRLVPYAERAAIERGALNGKNLELVWVDDPVDAFFLQIQGSGQVRLPDGRILRVGYAGKNGQPYFAIGRDLVTRGILTPENVSLQTIRAWLEANPGQAQALMNKNRSYVFFRLIQGAGPIGAQGVPLTPDHSLAVDRRFIPLGAPLWLDTTNPLSPGAPLRRLVIAQDTGGAIKGVVRGDLFWGAGERAREGAGKMKQRGRYYILLPRSALPKG